MRKMILRIFGIVLVVGWLGSLKLSIPEDKAYAETKAYNAWDNIVYQELVYEFLKPCIDEALADYYDKPIVYDRRDVTITSIGRHSFYFLFEVEVRKFLGGNSRIGIDDITIETGARNVRVLKYEHTEGFDFDKKVRRNPLVDVGNAGWPENIDDQRLYHDIAMKLLSPSIDRAIQDYYGVSFTHDPWSNEVLFLKRVHESGSPFYRMTIRVIPYSGPHRSVGIDHITFRLQPGPKIIVEEFQHVKSYEPSISFLLWAKYHLTFAWFSYKII